MKKNIAFLLTNLNIIGGVEKITSKLANELSSFYNVFVINTKSVSKSNLNEINNQVFLKDLFFKTSKIIFLFKALKFVKQNKINVLIIQAGFFGFLTYIRYLSFGHTKVIWCDHSSLLHKVEYNKTNEILRAKKAVKTANKVIVLTEDNNIFYKKYFHLNNSSNKVVTIPNFVDIDNKNVLYNQKSKIIVSVGRLHIQKRFDLLIEAFNKVKNKDGWILEIYGEGEEKSNLEKLISNFNLVNQIYLKGAYKNIDEPYLNKSFLVVTSEFEGFGIAILEGINYKLPVISFDCKSGPSDMIVNEFNGLLVPPLNVNQLTIAIEKLIDSEALRTIYSNNSFIIKEKFSKNAIIDMWKKLLNSM